MDDRSRRRLAEWAALIGGDVPEDHDCTSETGGPGGRTGRPDRRWRRRRD